MIYWIWLLLHPPQLTRLSATWWYPRSEVLAVLAMFFVIVVVHSSDILVLFVFPYLTEAVVIVSPLLVLIDCAYSKFGFSFGIAVGLKVGGLVMQVTVVVQTLTVVEKTLTVVEQTLKLTVVMLT